METWRWNWWYDLQQQHRWREKSHILLFDSCLQVRKHINDLYEDLRDGHNLISLLEVLSGDTLVSSSHDSDHPAAQAVKGCLCNSREEGILGLDVSPSHIRIRKAVFEDNRWEKKILSSISLSIYLDRYFSWNFWALSFIKWTGLIKTAYMLPNRLITCLVLCSSHCPFCILKLLQSLFHNIIPLWRLWLHDCWCSSLSVCPAPLTSILSAATYVLFKSALPSTSPLSAVPHSLFSLCPLSNFL